jgi:hypothetical protein
MGRVAADAPHSRGAPPNDITIPPIVLRSARTPLTTVPTHSAGSSPRDARRSLLAPPYLGHPNRGKDGAVRPSEIMAYQGYLRPVAGTWTPSSPERSCRTGSAPGTPTDACGHHLTARARLRLGPAFPSKRAAVRPGRLHLPRPPGACGGTPRPQCDGQTGIRTAEEARGRNALMVPFARSTGGDSDATTTSLDRLALGMDRGARALRAATGLRRAHARPNISEPTLDRDRVLAAVGTSALDFTWRA